MKRGVFLLFCLLLLICIIPAYAENITADVQKVIRDDEGSILGVVAETYGLKQRFYADLTDVPPPVSAGNYRVVLTGKWKGNWVETDGYGKKRSIPNFKADSIEKYIPEPYNGPFKPVACYDYLVKKYSHCSACPGGLTYDYVWETRCV